MKLEIYLLPSYLSSYFFNGDSSSLTDEEIEQADTCLKRIGLGRPASMEEKGFCHRHDFNESDLAADCAEFIFLSNK